MVSSTIKLKTLQRHVTSWPYLFNHPPLSYSIYFFLSFYSIIYSIYLTHTIQYHFISSLATLSYVIHIVWHITISIVYPYYFSFIFFLSVSLTLSILILSITMATHLIFLIDEMGWAIRYTIFYKMLSWW